MQNINQPYLSIVIATYKRINLLNRCLVSLLCQKGNYEVVVVEDGSNEAEKVIKNFCTDSCLRYLSIKKNVGSYQAINKAVKYCNGQIIAFLDDDAVVLPGWVSRIINQTKYYNDDFILTGHVGQLEDNSFSIIRQNYYEDRYRQYMDINYGKSIKEKFNIELSQEPLGYLIEHFSCSNVAMPRRMFEKLHGFHKNFRTLGSNEFSLYALINKIPIFYDPMLKIAHQHDSSTISMLKKMWKYGFYRLLLHNLYPNHTTPYPVTIFHFIREAYTEWNKLLYNKGLSCFKRLLAFMIIMTERFSYLFHANYRRHSINIITSTSRHSKDSKKF